MSQKELEALMGELFSEMDDVYELQAELDLLEYIDTVGYDAFLESEAS